MTIATPSAQTLTLWGPAYIRRCSIEPHVLFRISEAFVWLKEVKLLDSNDYEVIMAYIKEEKNGMGTSEPGKDEKQKV